MKHPFKLAPSEKALARFLAKIDIRGPDDCWLWTACRNRGGYGRFGFERKVHFSHRIAYMWSKGELPDDLTIDHFKCDNPPCNNPRHLKKATMGENGLRSSNFAAQNARKTHCPAGHPYKGRNLIRPHRRTWRERVCRICRNAWHKNYKRHKRAEQGYVRGPYKRRT
jgi:hypothetical protein